MKAVLTLIICTLCIPTGKTGRTGKKLGFSERFQDFYFSPSTNGNNCKMCLCSLVKLHVHTIKKIHAFAPNAEDCDDVSVSTKDDNDVYTAAKDFRDFAATAEDEGHVSLTMKDDDDV